MKKLLLLFSMLAYCLNMQAQSDSVVTWLANGSFTNAQSGIGFEVESSQMINITGISNVFQTSATTATVWYRIGGILASGQTTPSITAADGWVQSTVNVPVTGTGSSGNPTPISNFVPIQIPANTAVGIYIEGESHYDGSGTTPLAVNTVSNGPLTVKMGQVGGVNYGFGGVNGDWYTPRYFQGKVYFELAATGNCPAFTDFAIDSISGTAAKVDWIPGSGNDSFFLEYGPMGFTPGSGTTVTGTYPGSQPPVILTGLSAQTGYDVYFGEICNSGADSIYFPAPQSFTTTKLCATPTNFTTSNELTNSVDLNWNYAGGYQHFEVLYGPMGFNPATGGSSVSTSSGSPYTLGSLTPATHYDAYLVAYCGPTDGYSDTIGPVDFLTLCVLKTLPYVEDFSGGTFPPCWSRSSTSDVTYLSSCSSRNDVLEILQTADATTADIDVSGVLSQNLEVSYYVGAGACNNNPEDEDFIVEYWDGSQWVQAMLHNGNNMPNAFVHQSFYVPAGQFGHPFKVRFNMLEGTTDTWQIDSVVVQEGPACLDPTSNQINISNIGTTQATVFIGDSLSNFEYEWGPCGFTQGTGTIGSDSATTTVSGLNDDSCYDLYLRRDCDTAGYSSWNGPFSFHTLCTTKPLPYVEDFSGGVFPNCWSRSSTSDVTYLSSCSSRNNVLEILQTADATTAEIDVSGVLSQNLEVSYYVGAGACNNNPEDEDFIVEYWDGSQWVQAMLHNGNNMPNAFVHQTFYVPAGQFGHPFKVRFNMLQGTTDTWQIDSVVVQQAPLCLGPNPTTLGATNITATSADLFWGSGGEGDKTYVEVGPVGFSPGAGTAVVIDSVAGSMDSLSVTSLSPQTTYEFYTQDSCVAGGLGSWVGPYSFTTACLPQSLPYIENFNAAVFPVCWSRSSASDVTYEASCGRSDVVQLTNSASVTTALVDAGGAASLKVSYLIADGACGSAAEEEFHVDYWNGSQWVQAQVLHGSNLSTSFTSQSFLVPGGSFSNQFQVRFDAQEPGGTADDWQIDSVVIEQGPSCFPPLQLSAVNITDTSAVLDWDQVDSASSYQVWFGPQGFFQGTQTSGGVRTFVNADTLVVDTLSGITCYEFLVRSICGPNDTSAWSGPFSFCTECSPIVAPYLEDFELASGTTPPACWENEQGEGAEDWQFDVETSRQPEAADGDHTLGPGGGGIMAWLDDSDDEDSTNLLSPQIDLSNLTNPQMSFWMWSETENGPPAQQFILFIDVKDASGWHHNVDTFDIENSSWQQFIVDLSPYSNLVQVRFSGEDRDGNFYKDIAIDDVRFSDPITCPSPTDLLASNITAANADLTWNADSATPGVDFQISYGINLNDPTLGTTMLVTGDSVNVTGLMSSSDYCYYVREICTPGDTSFWAGPYCFTTACTVFPSPFFEDFELASGTTPPNCWENVQGEGAEDWQFDVETSRQPEAADGDHTLGPNGGGIMAWLDDSDDEDSTNMLSPLIDIGNLNYPLLKFWMWSETEGSNPVQQFPLHIDVNDGSGWVQDVAIFDVENTMWTEYTVDLSSFGDTIRIRFSGEDLSGDFYKDIAIDDVSVTDSLSSSCPSPANLSANIISCDSIELSWSSAEDTVWVTYIDTSGGQATDLNVHNDSTVLVTGTAPNTGYAFTVANICGSDTSAMDTLVIYTGNIGAPTANFTFNISLYEVSFDASASTGYGNTYSWDFDDGNTGAGVVDTNTYGSAGTYTVTLTVTNACGSDDTTVTITDVDLEESALSRSLTLYPNPTRSTVKVSFDSPDNAGIRIRVLDLSGKEVMILGRNNASGRYEETLDVSRLADGLYMIEIQSGDQVARRRLTKE